MGGVWPFSIGTLGKSGICLESKERPDMALFEVHYLWLKVGFDWT
jgi:hypothetical protein